MLQANVKDAKDAPCKNCSKMVIFNEQLRIEGVVFHHACFVCEHCNKKLSAGSYASLSQKYYCKPHFSQLFKSKGNYSEGFGVDDPKKKWQQQE